MIEKFWCADHVKAAKEYAAKYTQYARATSTSKLYRAKRNIGVRGTWVRKGEIVLGYKHDSLVSTNPVAKYEPVISFYSGHAIMEPEYTYNWCCSHYPDAFVEI